MEEGPFLVFKHEDSPWWMWPMLATVTITRDQWRARMIMVIIMGLLALPLGFVIFGPLGILFVLVLLAIASVFAYSSYKYGRKKAIEYSERLIRMR
jgi:hypothetical protein